MAASLKRIRSTAMKPLFLTTAAFAALVMITPVGTAHANATFAPCEGKVVTIAGQHFDFMDVDSLRRCATPADLRGSSPADPRAAARRQRLFYRECVESGWCK
jgi:hypothetical protein